MFLIADGGDNLYLWNNLKGDKNWTFVEGWVLSTNRILNSSSVIVKTK